MFILFIIFLILLIIFTLIAYSTSLGGISSLFWSLASGTAVSALLISILLIFVGFLIMGLGGIHMYYMYSWYLLFFVIAISYLLLVVLADGSCEKGETM